MELNASEVYGIIKSVEARLEWVKDNGDFGNEEEIPYLESALKKFKELKYIVKET